MDFLVLHDYKASEEDELSLKKGDTIHNCKVTEEGWMEGELNGRVGLFPDNFGKIVEKKMGVENRRGKVILTHNAKGKEELSISSGAVVDVIEDVDGERHLRIRTVDGREGKVPRHCIEIIASSTSNEHSNQATVATVVHRPPVQRLPHDELQMDDASNSNNRPISKVMGVGFGNIFNGGKIQLVKGPVSGLKKTTSEDRDLSNSALSGSNNNTGNAASPVMANKPFIPKLPSRSAKPQFEKAKVLYNYTAANEDELSLKVGDIVTILTKDCDDEGWWRGELGGKSGLFPDNFVEILPPSLASTPSTNAQTNELISAGRVNKAPPPVPVNKPKTPPPVQTNVTPGVDLFDGVAGSHSDSLVHLNQFRPKQPGKRKPSKFLGENEIDTPIKEEPTKDPVMEEDVDKKTKKVPPPRPVAKPIAASPSVRQPLPPQTHALTEETPSAMGDSRSQQQPPSHSSTKHTEPIGVTLRNNPDLPLAKEINFVSRAEYDKLHEEFDNFKLTCANRIQTLMNELDEEKKLRLSNQVELDRIKNIVMELDKRLVLQKGTKSVIE